jgi:cation transport ATPase
MIGNGINSALSFKAADIGISGSDIAIKAVDMVLLDFLSAIVLKL